MTHAAISVLTCPALRGQYLERTIASIDRAGGADFEGPKVIHIDGGGDIPRFAGWSVESLSGQRAGARKAMVAIMKAAAGARVATLLYFEDDVILCKNAIRAMLEIGVPQPLGFVTYCDLAWHPCPPLELAAFPGCPTNQPVPIDGFVGCQALALPLRTLERFVEPLPDWIDRNNCDATIGQIAECYGVVDSLANHVGTQSAIMGLAYERLRVVRGWRGEDFDADAVPRTFELGEIGERCAFHAGTLHADRRACASSSPAHAAVRAPAALDR
jgi:hypothetical protein